ncbi:MAG: ATP-dependent helicase, partial [Bdellovibrionales bacterium]|nr:ATP-dependent helicase [Bdellovibrionales bacterium]
VSCPQCKHENDFWGLTDDEGQVIEHFGQKCQGAIENPASHDIVPCGFRYRFKNCDACSTENDMKAKRCISCGDAFVDDQSKLKHAALQRDAHVMRPDHMEFLVKADKKGNERLEIRYYDLDGKHLSEVFFFNNPQGAKVFYYNFERMHHRTPGPRLHLSSIPDVLAQQWQFRKPLFIIARKQDKYWRIREKIFVS